MKNALLLAALAAFVSGCFTFNTSELPSTRHTPLPNGATNVTATVRGFEAVLTEYVPIVGYSTVYVPGHVGRHHVHPGYYETVQTSTYVPQTRPDETFKARAVNVLEECGFITRSATPDFVIDVAFSGFAKTDSEISAEVAWVLLSAFTCDYDAQTWGAKLKIYDNKTGRLVFHHGYVQRYETNVFSPIPLFGIAGCAETTSNYMQSWCLTALTERAMADATAFLANAVAAPVSK